MTEKSETAEAKIRFERVPLTPLSWCVECPGCGQTVGIDEMQVDQDPSGFWRVNGPDQFPKCENCGAHIEVTPIAITEMDPR